MKIDTWFDIDDIVYVIGWCYDPEYEGEVGEYQVVGRFLISEIIFDGEKIWYNAYFMDGDRAVCMHTTYIDQNNCFRNKEIALEAARDMNGDIIF